MSCKLKDSSINDAPSNLERWGKGGGGLSKFAMLQGGERGGGYVSLGTSLP